MNKETELNCREAFEAWAADYYNMRNFTRDMDYDGSYINPINNEWEAWQAAWEHKTNIEAQLQAEVERLRFALMKCRDEAQMLPYEDIGKNWEAKGVIIDILNQALQHDEENK